MNGTTDAGAVPFAGLVGSGLSVLIAPKTLVALLIAWLAYKVIEAAWNISPFHPLSHIPGPRLAAATYLPEFYYDVVLFGRYTWEIEKMHRMYGPIVRINPGEVHCIDSSFMDEIYAMGGRKRDKPYHQVAGNNNSDSGFGTTDHDVHRMRRAPVARFFSRAMIARLENRISLLAQRLCDRLISESGPIEVTTAYSLFTSDAISEYAFGESFHLLEQEGYERNLRKPLHATLHATYIFRFFPFLRHTYQMTPFLIPIMPTSLAFLITTLTQTFPAYVRKAEEDKRAGIVHPNTSIFASLLDSNLPPDLFTRSALANEAQAILGAGTETTAWALSVITFHLLTKPELLARLTEEVQTVVTDPCNLPPWNVLEKLPYLGGVIQEGLRLSYGVSSRSSRVATGEDLVYRGTWKPQNQEKKEQEVTYVIPAGYAVGMSSVLTNHDESIFPDSRAFKPERWFDAKTGERRKELEKTILTFGKGSRMCLGMNLAYCEMYLLLTALTLRVFPRMRLYETTEADIAYDYDMFIPMVRKESLGVRVLVE